MVPGIPPGSSAPLRSAAPRWAKVSGICSPSDRAGARLVCSLPRGFQPSGGRVPMLSEATRAGRLCQSHRVLQRCQCPAPSPHAHWRRAQGSNSRGRTRPRPTFLPLHWRLADGSGHAQSKTTDTIDFATPVLHTYLYSHRSVPLTPNLLGIISCKTKSS